MGSWHPKIAERIDKSFTTDSMEIGAVRTKLMINNTSGTKKEIKVNEHGLESVTCIKYLGSVVSYEGCKPEILSRTAQTTAALTRVKPV